MVSAKTLELPPTTGALIILRNPSIQSSLASIVILRNDSVARALLLLRCSLLRSSTDYSINVITLSQPVYMFSFSLSISMWIVTICIHMHRIAICTHCDGSFDAQLDVKNR